MACQYFRERKLTIQGREFWVRFWHHGAVTVCSIVFRRQGLTMSVSGSACCHPNDSYSEWEGEKQAARRTCGIGDGDGYRPYCKLGEESYLVYRAIRKWLAEQKMVEVLDETAARYRVPRHMMVGVSDGTGVREPRGGDSPDRR